METVAEDWYHDHVEAHEARCHSAGAPTALVRDGTVEGSDAPPLDRHTCPVVRVEVPGSPGDLRRDDESQQPRPVDRPSSRQTAMDTVCA